MDSVAKVIFRVAFAPVALIAWWSVVMALWRSQDDMKIAAVAIAAIGVALIGSVVADLYKKFAGGGW